MIIREMTKYNFSVLSFSEFRTSFITQSAPFIVSYRTAVSVNNYKTDGIVIRGSIERSSLKLTRNMLLLKLKQTAEIVEK